LITAYRLSQLLPVLQITGVVDAQNSLCVLGKITSVTPFEITWSPQQNHFPKSRTFTIRKIDVRDAPTHDEPRLTDYHVGQGPTGREWEMRRFFPKCIDCGVEMNGFTLGEHEADRELRNEFDQQ
jgi:hypothetical protein